MREEDITIKVEKIWTRKVSEQVVEQIEQWIVTGKVKAGEKLPSVRQLCERFEVGRSAVRDAMTTLKGKGLIDVRQGEGAFVRRFDSSTLVSGIQLADEKDISELFNVRKILEVGTAEMAARFRKKDDLKKMKQAIDDWGGDEGASGWGADYRFHLATARATQNGMLVQMMETIAAVTKKVMIGFHGILVADDDLAANVFDQHCAVYEAIRDGKPQEARIRMLEHLTFTEALLDQYLADRDTLVSSEG